MGPITLTWLAAIIFSGLVFWGVNVPTGKRTPAVYWVTGILIVLHLFTQSFLFRVDASPSASATAKRTAVEAMANFEKFLEATAIGPGKLHYRSPLGWYRVVTSSFLHYGWLHLIFNAWFFVLFGHVLETLFGARKFLWIVGAGLIIPPALDGFFPVGLSKVDVRFTGGFSGVVYAVMGAYLVCFPNSRAYGALNYDLRFWAAIMFLLLPVTMVTRFAGVALTETVLIMGFVAAFLLIQPEHARISVPVIAVMVYKVLQDIFLLEPAVREVFSNSVWRIGGGFATGIVGGFVFNGMRGWKLRWGDDTKEAGKKSANTRTRMSVAKLEAEGRKSQEGARIYLGQRVFVGDAEKAIAFYREVIMPKFPDVALPLQEQMALARLLHFKGYDVEALHAYETLLKSEPLPEEFTLARLKAAELIIKLAPERSQRARELLDRFEQGRITMVRDKVEAQRLRAMLPVVQEEYRELEDGAGGNTEPTKTVVYAEVVPDSASAVTSTMRRTRKMEAAENTTLAPGGLDAPKVRPKSFIYVPGSSPVIIAERKKAAVAGDGDGLSDAELLQKHWKPLPATVSSKPLPVSVLDRRVKNARVADEDQKPSLYGNPAVPRTERRQGGRLSQLELIKMSSEMPVSEREMPGMYGGLEDLITDEKSEGALKIRLRREKEGRSGETAEGQERRSRRTSEARETDRKMLDWGNRIKLQAMPELPEDFADECYGESTDALAAGETEQKWAVLLTDPVLFPLARELKTSEPELTEEYGAIDYSEVSGGGFNPLFVFRQVRESDRSKVQDAVDCLKLPVQFVSEDDAVLKIEPVEITSVTVGTEGLGFKTAFGSRRLAWNEVALISLCDIRLTPNSRGLHRYLLEFVTLSGKPQRYQVFERTVTVKGSTVNGHQFVEVRTMLESAWKAACEMAAGALINPYATNMGASGVKQFPTFESYAWYNEEILRLLIIGKAGGGEPD